MKPNDRRCDICEFDNAETGCPIDREIVGCSTKTKCALRAHRRRFTRIVGCLDGFRSIDRSLPEILIIDGIRFMPISEQMMRKASSSPIHQ